MIKKLVDNFAIRATLVYVIAAGIWITASDWLLGLFITDPHFMAQVATLKGWFFVAVTATILYIQLHGEWKTIYRQQAEIRNNEQQLKLVINNSPSSIFIQDLNQRYTAVINPPMGLSESDFLGFTDREIFNAEQADFLESLKKDVLVTHCGVDGEGFLSVSGHQAYFDCNIEPHYDASGEMDGLIVFARDLTEHKKTEDDLYRLNLELEERVELRTSELQDAIRELESFSYSVSHDLRAPLRTIDGMGKILVEDYAAQLDEQALDYIQRMQNASRHMNQLIEALLQLSKVTRSELRRVEINLSRIALEVINELFSSRDSVTWKIKADIMLFADPTLMRVVLVNLLGNAYKFTGKCEKAEIELGVIDRNGVPVYFVRDNGVGFDMEFAGKLFAPFQRLNNSNDFEGTGIGLALVQRIINRHSGRIWAEALMGQGAAFYFTLGE
ncbi:MAG: ATP-binding protein [Anaerolineae bacterium]|nr:ATP-binding protein [Anaerolineae bacterium]